MRSLPTGSVTFLFTDIEGSTRLFQRLGDRFPDLLYAHRQILRTAFSANGGSEVKSEGDGFFVAFADPAEAVAACLSAQRDLSSHPWPTGSPIRVRMGLHTGEGTPTQDGDYLGLPVHQAARIAGTGHGGQILISEQTATLVRDRLPGGAGLIDLGSYRLKDFDGAERIYQLTHADLIESFPALRAAPAQAHNLPEVRTTFIGREREIEELLGLMAAGRLVTTVGPGGVGKTRLALEVASRLAPRLPGGARLVDLTGLSDPDLVAPTAAAVFGLRPQPGSDPTTLLADELSLTETLLVLDNCEHVLEASAVLADALLSRCPDLHLLATSREPLGVAGEQVWRISTLPVPAHGEDLLELLGVESVRLFSDRAALADARFRVSADNAASVATICRMLDGIPLALELVAARVATVSPENIVRRLEDRLDMVSNARVLSERHRSLDAAIEWSYRLLDEPERTLFRALSVFAGGFTLEAVTEVAGEPDIDALTLLAGLVDKSLVVRDTATDRYRMLETIRQFARTRSVEAGEIRPTRDRHLRWAAALAERAEPELRTADQAHWLDLIEAELDNLRAAVAWALEGDQPVEGLRLAGSLNQYWTIRGSYVEGREWCERLLEAAPDAPALLRGRALRVAADGSWDFNEFDRALDLGTQALAAFRAAGDVRWMVSALNTLGGVTGAIGDFESSLRYHREMIELARSVGDGAAVAVALGNMGEIARGTGDLSGAREHMEESVRVARQVGTPSVLCGALLTLGYLLLDVGDTDGARETMREVLHANEHARSLTSLTLVLDGLTRLSERTGEPELAARLLGASDTLRSRKGLRLDPSDQRALDEARTRIEGALGRERTQELVEDASGISVEQATQLALGAATG